MGALELLQRALHFYAPPKDGNLDERSSTEISSAQSRAGAGRQARRSAVLRPFGEYGRTRASHAADCKRGHSGRGRRARLRRDSGRRRGAARDAGNPPRTSKFSPPASSPPRREGAALAAVSAASPRGWKRGLRHSELFFKHSGEDVSALRLYIIRGPLLIDAFTGESSGAASLIEFII